MHWGAVHTEDRNVTKSIGIFEVTLDVGLQLATLSSEGNVECAFLLKRLAVIDIERARRIAIIRQGDNEAPGVLARFSSGVARLLSWENRTTTDVDGDVAQGSGDGDIGTCLSLDLLASVPIVP